MTADIRTPKADVRLPTTSRRSRPVEWTPEADRLQALQKRTNDRLGGTGPSPALALIDVHFLTSVAVAVSTFPLAFYAYGEHTRIMTFGLSTTIDALSWAIVLLLGLKVVATIVLLGRDKESWFQTRWSAGLWWATKATPFLAVPCLIAIALLEQRIGDVWVYGALMFFVVVAVPIVVWRKFNRETGSAKRSVG